MRAVVLQDGDLVVDDIPEPTPGRGQVLVRTLANGICGSDLHAIDMMRDSGMAFGGDAQVVLGHEYCATIIDHGPGTDRRHPVGTNVCANPFVPSTGSLVNPGGLAELMVLDESALLAVPPSVLPEHAALTEPLAVGIRAVQVAGYRSGRGPYVVVGCGPIGLAVILALRAAGKGPIIAADFSEPRRAIAEKLGADVIVDAAVDDPYAHVRDFGFESSAISALLPHGSADDLGATIFECVGVPGVLQQILDGAPPHSHVVVAGVCMQPDTILPMAATMKETTLSFTLAYRPEEFALAHRRIVDGSVDASPMISATVPLDETAWAFDALRRTEHAKIVVQTCR